jgi:hypothetical protein
MILNLDQLTTEEKIEAMELLWDAICQGPSEVEVPEWHGAVLSERDHVSVDENLFLDWEQAKRDIRNSLS